MGAILPAFPVRLLWSFVSCGLLLAFSEYSQLVSVDLSLVLDGSRTSKALRSIVFKLVLRVESTVAKAVAQIQQ